MLNDTDAKEVCNFRLKSHGIMEVILKSKESKPDKLGRKRLQNKIRSYQFSSPEEMAETLVDVAEMDCWDAVDVMSAFVKWVESNPRGLKTVEKSKLCEEADAATNSLLLRQTKIMMHVYNVLAFTTRRFKKDIDYDHEDMGVIFRKQLAYGELTHYFLTGQWGIFDDLSSNN